MPNGKLTARKVETAKQGSHEDGGGLRIVVSPSGSKRWVLRYTIDKKRREMGLGSFPEVSLVDARDFRHEARKLIASGTDPINQRKAVSLEKHETPTFDMCSKLYIESKRPEWSNAKHATQWTNTLRDYASPIIGNKPVDQVNTDDLKLILKPIWLTKTETAKRVRNRIENILNWAKANKHRSGENPAAWRGHLDHLLPKPEKIAKVVHHPAMPYQELPKFIQLLTSTRESLSAKALFLTILCGTRTSETLNAQWSEIDLEDHLWTIPEERMKAGREHRIPLTEQMVTLIQSIPKINQFVFPGMKKNKPLSNMAMLVALRKLGYGQYTVHGFRSTFRDWCAEQTMFPSEIAEAALAHANRNKVEAAYQRGDLLEKRRTLMEAWSLYATSIDLPANVTTLVAART
ncbi:MAG: integrase arm-type DNA-binding domain-containing protein [Methylococcales bacterium]|jgi:integrase|nr:integrase arm-type DNA-binding domain-containing protein [Methylococcales bacterium]